LILEAITINAVAPAATLTNLLPSEMLAKIQGSVSISTPHHVGLAIVYSAVAKQDHAVEAYGKDSPEAAKKKGPWNGRVIVTLGDQWTEVEEPLARVRPEWFGEWNTEMTAMQQRSTDIRPRLD
jgi:hypothetical protein